MSRQVDWFASLFAFALWTTLTEAASPPATISDSVNVATPEWSRTLRRAGKDWFVFDNEVSEGPAKPSIVSRVLEVYLRDRSRLPQARPPVPCPTVLFLGNRPGDGLTVCRSESEYFVLQRARATPAARDGVQVLVSALRSPADLLDPRLVPWNPDRVKQIEVTSRGKTTRIERQGVLWGSPVAHELLRLTLKEDRRPRKIKPDMTLVVRGLGDELIVIRAQGKAVQVSNRSGTYTAPLSVSELAARLTRP